ncbi:MAG TPA: GNAT family N-acetyltransferase [Pseudolabrys sp.]|nr:GNAT family N-acetyltransferase [Pseudolabrys sp.]
MKSEWPRNEATRVGGMDLAPPRRAQLRQAMPTDVDRLHSLECRSFSHHRISRRSFARLMSSPTTDLIVADREFICAGYALVLFRSGSPIARLYSIAVDPLAGRSGIGSMLLEAAEQRAVQRGSGMMRLEVHEHNRAAIDLYAKLGYGKFGERRGYYADGCDALRLQKQLSAVTRFDQMQGVTSPMHDHRA